MHIEKNVCDNVLGTMMNMEGKTKETAKSRKDLAEMEVKKELHLRREGQYEVMPHVAFTLTEEERKKVCQWLKNL